MIHRVRRLLDPEAVERRGPGFQGWPPALATAAVVLCMIGAMHLPVHAERTASAQDAATSAAPAGESHDFLSGIVAAGFRNLTVDELINLKIHGVTPELARAVKQAGYTNVTASELVEMSIHGVDVEYMRAVKSRGLNGMPIADLISLRIHGVTPDYIDGLRDNGMKDLSVEQLIRLKQSGF